MSKLYFWFGVMSCSKTALLLMKAHTFQERGIPFLCLKPNTDDRDGTTIIKSRVGIQRECVSLSVNDNFYEFMKAYLVNIQMHGYDKPKWLLVDEAQFLTCKQVDELARIVDEMDINVMCYGLRTDFRTELFDGAKRLMEISDELREIESSCGCGRRAIVNARIDSNGKVVNVGNQIEIGGNDKYVTLCRKCYKEALKVNEKN